MLTDTDKVDAAIDLAPIDLKHSCTSSLPTVQEIRPSEDNACADSPAEQPQSRDSYTVHTVHQSTQSSQNHLRLCCISSVRFRAVNSENQSTALDHISVRGFRMGEGYMWHFTSRHRGPTKCIHIVSEHLLANRYIICLAPSNQFELHIDGVG